MLPQIALGQSQSAVLSTAYFENDILDLVNVFIPPLMSSTMNADVLNRNKTTDSEGAGRPEKADDEKLLAKVRTTSEGSPNGVTSICADIRAGRKTEVDTISGSVVRASKKCGVPAPTHEFVVEMIHALEGRPKN